jgi:hypothetical protein
MESYDPPHADAALAMDNNFDAVPAPDNTFMRLKARDSNSDVALAPDNTFYAAQTPDVIVM